MKGSHLRFKGTENIGSRLKAIFDIENGFSVATGKFGQREAIFGRQAWVGLSTGEFGSVSSVANMIFSLTHLKTTTCLRGLLANMQTIHSTTIG
jgi:hypothetical protein